MTDEDHTAERLKGNNCLIKFRDGEELMLYISELDADDSDAAAEWLLDVEKFINGNAEVEYFPGPGLALSRNSVKYVRRI